MAELIAPPGGAGVRRRNAREAVPRRRLVRVQNMTGKRVYRIIRASAASAGSMRWSHAQAQEMRI